MTARSINKLTALQVKKAKPNPDKMYKLPDGGNLYLRMALLHKPTTEGFFSNIISK